MSLDYGERIRAVETTQASHAHEIERLRDGHHDTRGQLGIISTQVGSLASQVAQISAQTELIAERAAHKVLAAWAAQHHDDGETSIRKLAFRAVLLALGIAAAALGVKFAGIT